MLSLQAATRSRHSAATIEPKKEEPSRSTVKQDATPIGCASCANFSRVRVHNADAVTHTLMRQVRNGAVAEKKRLQSRQLAESAELQSVLNGELVIGPGSAGKFVGALQTALRTLGYSLPRYGIDQKYGAETRAALTAFQKDHGLEADGEAGAKTLAAMDQKLLSSSVTINYNIELRGGTMPSPPENMPAPGAAAAGLHAVATSPSATIVDPQVALQAEKDYWLWKNKEAIIAPFLLSESPAKKFDFGDPKSWEAMKLREEPSKTPKLAPFKSQQTNDLSTFYVNDSLKPQNFVHLMLGRFISGIGPENFVFPKNGAVSLQMRDAAIAQSALTQWYYANYEAILSGGKLSATPEDQRFQSFDIGAQTELLWEKMGIINIPQFVGSASVVIEPLVSVAPQGTNPLYLGKDELLVTIRNVTSATSGDIYKHFYVYGEAPSYPKDTTRPATQQFTNISETFQFTLPIDRARALNLRQKAKYSEETR